MGVTQFAWLLTLQPYDSVDVINIDVSDSAFESWQPGVETWRRYVTGVSSLLGNVYFQPRITVPVFVRSYSDQDPDDTLITLLQTRDFTNAKATLSVRRLDAAPPDTVVVFTGVVRSTAPITRELMTFDLVGEDATSIRPLLEVTEAQYPERRQFDETTLVPILAGATGWDASILLRDMGQTVAGLATSTEWRFLVPSRGMTTGRIVDVTGGSSGLGGYDVRVNSVPGITQPSGTAGPLNVALWPDDSRVPVELINAAAAVGFDLINIQSELAANYPASSNTISGPPLGGPQDGQLRVRRFHTPNEVDDATITGWANWWNGLDRSDYGTYAEARPGQWASKFTSAGRFMRYPSRPYLVIRRADGADPRLCALVWGWSNTGNNLLWEMELKTRGATLASFTIDLTAQAGGWALITANLQDNIVSNIAGVDDFINFQGTLSANRKWWGEDTDPADTLIDHISVWAPNAATNAAFAPRVSTLGVSFEHLVDPGPLMALSKGGYLRGLESKGDQIRPADVLVSQATQGITASDAIIELMINSTLDAQTPIVGGDFNTGSGVGSWVELENQMNTSITGETSGAVTSWILSLMETADLTLDQILTKASNEIFADIWYSPRTGLYNAQLFQANQASHGALLSYDDIMAERIEVVGGMSADNVYTAIYLDCWNGSRTVSIDNSARGSRTWDGSTDAVREGHADVLQGIFGRRVLRRSFEYIRDPAALWDICARMWGLLRDVRPVCRFAVDPAWALEREQSEVFTTDASLDAIMPVPIRGETSWANQTWQIRLVEIEPRGGCWVTATWNGPFNLR